MNIVLLHRERERQSLELVSGERNEMASFLKNVILGGTSDMESEILFESNLITV
jgi:hypothetical protein